jgi:hypothetical protein
MMTVSILCLLYGNTTSSRLTFGRGWNRPSYPPQQPSSLSTPTAKQPPHWRVTFDRVAVCRATSSFLRDLSDAGACCRRHARLVETVRAGSSAFPAKVGSPVIPHSMLDASVHRASTQFRQAMSLPNSVGGLQAPRGQCGKPVASKPDKTSPADGRFGNSSERVARHRQRPQDAGCDVLKSMSYSSGIEMDLHGPADRVGCAGAHTNELIASLEIE